MERSADNYKDNLFYCDFSIRIISRTAKKMPKSSSRMGVVLGGSCRGNTRIEERFWTQPGFFETQSGLPRIYLQTADHAKHGASDIGKKKGMKRGKTYKSALVRANRVQFLVAAVRVRQFVLGFGVERHR